MCLKTIPLIDAKIYLDIISYFKTWNYKFMLINRTVQGSKHILIVFLFRSFMINIPLFGSVLQASFSVRNGMLLPNTPIKNH